MSLYRYKAVITAVYDGDSVTADIDLGLKTWVKGEKLRLARINAPEVRGAEREQGLLARDFLRELIVGKEVTIETMKDKKGKYGRYIAEIVLSESGGVDPFDGIPTVKVIYVNDFLVSKGFAVYRDY